MLPVEVVKSVGTQMCLSMYVCGRDTISKSREATLFVYKDPVWDRGLATFESDNFPTSPWMKQTLTERFAFSFKVHARGTHYSFSASLTHTHTHIHGGVRLYKATYAEVVRACHSLLTVIPSATLAVSWLKSPLIVWVCLSVKKHISSLLQKNAAKISMTFFKKKILFFRHKNRNQMTRRETKAFLPFWTSHSLRLGAQALHKMSIDKFSRACVTHAQFESYRWGRKRCLFPFGFPLQTNFCCKAANMRHQWQEHLTRRIYYVLSNATAWR